MYDEAIKIDPKDVEAYNNKGWFIKFIRIINRHFVT